MACFGVGFIVDRFSSGHSGLRRRHNRYQARRLDVVLGFHTKPWIGGVLVQNWRSLAGNNSKPVVNQMNRHYFL
jgi:hypothetical protein